MASSQVVVRDIGALDQFASSLARACDDLERAASAMRSAIDRVGSSWQDPQKERCAQDIQAIQSQINKFSQQARDQVSYCRRLSQHLKSTPT